MKSLLLLLIVVLAASIPLVIVPPVVADDNEIEVLQQRAESDFPNGVKFFIEARSPDEIDEIRVFFKKLGQTSRSGYRSVEFEPGEEIRGESLIQSGSAGEYIPPGTRIEFSFEIRDRGGRVLRTEDQVFVYLDNRFEWGTVSDGLITVYHNGPGSQEQAQVMLQTAQETLERMRPVLGIDPSDPLHIVAYNNYGQMEEALPFRSQATSEQLITQGTAFTEERVLLVFSGEPGYLGTTSHEFVHLLVADATGRAIARVPSWLNEGLAEYGNVEGSESYDRYLAQAIESGQLRPLWHQQSFSGTPRDIIVAYGQGKSVVEFMVSTYGEEKMAQLTSALKSSFDIEASLQEVYGFDQYGLDSQWRESRGLEPLPPPQDRQAQQPATPTPRPTLGPTPTRTPTPVPQAASTPGPLASAPEATLAAPQASGNQEEPQQSSPGCNAPSSSGATAVDLMVLALIGGPLALVGARAFRRR